MTEPKQTTLCDDEGCEHFGTPHVCIFRLPDDRTVKKPIRLCVGSPDYLNITREIVESQQ